MQTLIQKYNSDLLSAIPNVQPYKTKFQSLNDWWHKITLVGKINSYSIADTILQDMAITQSKFNDLQDKLIDNLILEHLKKTVLENSSISQVAIDILIRNLFERTADVGFLATDYDIRQFLQSTETSDASLLFIEQRLSEYVKKYSVYNEIIILDIQGNVRANLDQNNPVTYSNDPLIEQTLNSSEEYVETFRHSDLQENQRHSLIYSCKIVASDEEKSPIVGVLCLCFKFDNEVESIFKKLLNNQSNTLLIKDRNNQVIASSNENTHPIETIVSNKEKTEIYKDNGNKSLSISNATNGYEGFYGLGWIGQVISPLNIAFNDQNENGSLAPEFSNLDINNSSSFSSELKSIKKESVEINDDLSLLVLNGQITSARKNATEFMPILQAIQKIGEDISNIFLSSVDSLQATIISSHCNSAQFSASLAVDIMDRNLYERANDCRWWALTSSFRKILSQKVISNDDKSQLTATLASINELYTVYTNLYLYDANGTILAVSNIQEENIIGTNVSEMTGASEALSIRDSQKYTVSTFRPTSLYDNRHTYIYNASITQIDKNTVVGGIGIVFDSEPQFKAMLLDTLPVNENEEQHSGSFAFFTDRQKNIISSVNNNNNNSLPAGALLTIEDSYFTLANGKKNATIMSFQGKTYILGYATSDGYREYKTTEDYKNDVIAFIFIPF